MSENWNVCTIATGLRDSLGYAIPLLDFSIKEHDVSCMKLPSTKTIGKTMMLKDFHVKTFTDDNQVRQ